VATGSTRAVPPRSPGAAGRAGSTKRPGFWKRRSRRTRRLIVVGSAVVFLGLVLFVGVLYAATKIPLNSVGGSGSTIYAADGTTELGHSDGVKRDPVTLDQVPVGVQHAVLAAEDKRFYSEPGISPIGILRALYTDLKGGSISQGGSTITQQYAKNTYLTSQRTFSRKLKEIVIAVKLDNKYSKDQILELYLNKIYFGRGAYGIGAASEAYFNKPVSQLTPQQGAILAGLIRQPSYLDPEKHPDAAASRYHQVIDTMVAQNWLSAADAATPVPAVVSATSTSASTSSSAVQRYLQQRVVDELISRGVPEADLNQGNYKIVTTIDPKAQAAAEAAVASSATKVKSTVDIGLVAVDPATGGIRAYIGGRAYDPSVQNGTIDAASYQLLQPGSGFKPIVLAAALQKGVGLNSLYNGANNQTFADYKVHNFNNESFGQIDLVKATAESVNTVYVKLGLDVGIPTIKDTAHAMGIPNGGGVKLANDASISLGTSAVHLQDMAQVYATFANRGVAATQYIVTKVLKSDGSQVASYGPQTNKAIDAASSDDATYAMSQVIANGTGTTAQLANGRPAAGKTGTTTGNTAAWFNGFTPQLAASVAVFRYDLKGVTTADVPGYSELTGGSLPAATWKKFMDTALAGQPVVPLPARANVGNSQSSAAPTTSYSPTGVPTVDATYSPLHTASPEPTLSLPPSRTPAASPSATATPTHTPSPASTALPTMGQVNPHAGEQRTKASRTPSSG
jgi:membrane peptidoglycan carboxypeptidase